MVLESLLGTFKKYRFNTICIMHSRYDILCVVDMKLVFVFSTFLFLYFNETFCVMIEFHRINYDLCSNNSKWVINESSGYCVYYYISQKSMCLIYIEKR